MAGNNPQVSIDPFFPSDFLINGIYRDIYFDLDKVDNLPHPERHWWSSKERYARYTLVHGQEQYSANGATASDFLEIDLGRIRQINHIGFDIVRAPITITIEYDPISAGNGDRQWTPVNRYGTNNKTDMPFDDNIHYDANQKSAWFSAQFYVSSNGGSQPINTRYLRIRFDRNDVKWPTGKSTPFRWPICVQNLRCARYIAGYEDTVGPLIISGFDQFPVPLTAPINPTIVGNNTTREVLQRFTFPAGSQRGNLIPNIIGIGFGVNVPEIVFSEKEDTKGKLPGDALWEWSIYNMTDPVAPVLLRNGTAGRASKTGQNWIDTYFPKHLISGDLDAIYELRVFSKNAFVSSEFEVHNSNVLNTQELPSEWTFTNGSDIAAFVQPTPPLDDVEFNKIVQVGDFVRTSDNPTDIYEVLVVDDILFELTLDHTFNYPTPADPLIVERLMLFSAWDEDAIDYVTDQTKSLVLRVWTDTADEGQDILNNAYRHATYKDDAAKVFDKTKLGWISAPKPSPNAVEALFFDVRTKDNLNVLSPTAIDGMKIAPETPGVNMHIYYVEDYPSDQAKPQTEDQWNGLTWTPLNQSYQLRGQAIFDFPSKIRASMIKLEFSNLNPVPYKIPTQPKLPPVLYNRFPSWVDTAFDNSTNYRRLIEDWFIRTRHPKRQFLTKTSKTEAEFEQRERAFLNALAKGNLSKDKRVSKSKIVDVKSRSIIDPVVAQNVFIRTNGMFGSNLLNTVEKQSLLANMVTAQASDRGNGAPIEGDNPFSRPRLSPSVSTVNDRVSESYSHIVQTPRWFNTSCTHTYKKELGEFNGVAYFVGISEIEFLKTDFQVLHDDELIDDLLNNSVFTQTNTFIPQQGTRIESGQTVYITYTIGKTTYIDEPILLSGNSPTALLNTGEVGKEKRIFSEPKQKGTEYFLQQDYLFGYEETLIGDTINLISRASAVERFTVPPSESGGVTTYDGNIVTAHIHPSAIEEYDAAISVESVDLDTVTIIGTPISSEALYGSGTYGSEDYGDTF